MHGNRIFVNLRHIITIRSAQWGKETAIDAKFDAYVYGSAVNDLERGQLDHITPDLWQNDTSVAKNSWGYTIGNDYKKPSDVVLDLIDVVSKMAHFFSISDRSRMARFRKKMHIS